MAKKKSNDLVSNRKAFHDYEIIETHEAGIQLVGTEVKSLKEHSASLAEAYVIIKKGEAFLKNATIMPYAFGNVFNHEEKRDRKLLLHSYEIEKLQKQVDQKGMAIVPLAIYLSKGRIKLKIGLGKGKKSYDKRQALKTREQKRAIDQAMKG